MTDLVRGQGENPKAKQDLPVIFHAVGSGSGRAENESAMGRGANSRVLCGLARDIGSEPESTEESEPKAMWFLPGGQQFLIDRLCFHLADGSP
jgi:hypothetical protein